MDILKAEIAKKTEAVGGKGTFGTGSEKKFFKRGELIAKEREEYRKKYYLTNEDNDKSTKVTIVNCRFKQDMKKQNLMFNIVYYQGRKLYLDYEIEVNPFSFFGETEIDAFKRLRKCELLEPEINRGFRNDFQEAMEQVDQAYLDELLQPPEGASNTEKCESKSHEHTITYEEIREMAKKMGRGNREHDMTVIVHFIQLILKKWSEQLQNRSGAEKTGTKGKLLGATYTQTQVYLKPLLRKLKNFTLPKIFLTALQKLLFIC
ncbi:hypothetical protein NQ314_019710 [Rhamnusium bicolor]|uniref:Pre-mRNA-splicing factor 18 n=1 Tax=Rhamnusium bicolor TaxID=1586634 RepID=A0AAV8WMK4_9CUCU|nr:hypothetical protein NQ314_019710 [Rhamnusium bicolor]